MKEITVDGTKVAETAEAGGTYTLEGYGQPKVAQKVYFGKKPNFDKVTGTCDESSKPIALDSGEVADQGTDKTEYTADWACTYQDNYTPRRKGICKPLWWQ